MGKTVNVEDLSYFIEENFKDMLTNLTSKTIMANSVPICTKVLGSFESCTFLPFSRIYPKNNNQHTCKK